MVTITKNELQRQITLLFSIEFSDRYVLYQN